MFPIGWLGENEVREYVTRISEELKPTALALSVLDVKQPANWGDKAEVTEHWCLTHYLLDGHHKVYAASNLNQPITLLSFPAIKQSLATEEQITMLFDVL